MSLNPTPTIHSSKLSPPSEAAVRPELLTPSGQEIALRRVPAIVEYAARKAEQGAPGRRAGLHAEKNSFEAALAHLDEEARAATRDLLEALRFIDYADLALPLMEAFRGGERDLLLSRKLQLHYNRNRSSSDPEFRNMQRVNSFLKQSSSAPSLRRLLEVHEIAMQEGVDDLHHHALGTVRDIAVIGDETTDGITPLEVKRVEKNVYLSFEDEPECAARSRATGRRYGRILYPDPLTIKDEALSRISETHPSVFRQVTQLRALPVASQISVLDSAPGAYGVLIQDLITALCEERYAAYAHRLKALGELTTPKDVLEFIKVTAQHYRDLISIHPMRDGNGRSVRYESLYDPFDKVGISRPRLNDPNADVLFSPSDWVREVERGILSTDALYRDVEQRIRYGLLIERSPQLLFPNLARDVGIELRVRGRRTREKNVTLAPIDGAQFGAFAHHELARDRALARAFKKTPLPAMATIRLRFKEFVKGTTALCHIPGHGTEQVGLSLVDLDYQHAFAGQYFAEAERWQFKIARWYQDVLLWRGLCSTSSCRSVTEILNLFRVPSDISLCNNLLEHADAPVPRIMKKLAAEFDRYNRDLISGTLYEKVIGHVEEGAGYPSSYGLSTSRRWGVAAGFAWGRGTFGYKDDLVSSRQDEISERLVIGAYQANKDVDVRRFRFLDPRFSYKFGRQQEILAIGGIDPDAVMVVQLLDRRRKVERSFVRSRSSPSSVYEFTGGDGDILARSDLSQIPGFVRIHQLEEQFHSVRSSNHR